MEELEHLVLKRIDDIKDEIIKVLILHFTSSIIDIFRNSLC